MQISEFQFTNPVLLDFLFEINKEFELKENEEINTNVSFNTNISRNPEKMEAIVELTVIIGSQDKESPFYIKATEGANFKWDEKVNKNADKLLKQNAPALLVSYLRSTIATITAASPFNVYNLPFINFMK